MIINFQAVAVAWVLRVPLFEIPTKVFLSNLSFEGQLGFIVSG